MADSTPRAGLCFHYDALAKSSRHRGRQQPTGWINRTTRRERHDHRDVAAGIWLSVGNEAEKSC
jgi:hypothetical protein